MLLIKTSCWRVHPRYWLRFEPLPVWRTEKQNQNAQEIARQAANMYDKFVDFSNDLIKVGVQLDGTQKTYAEAMKKLTEGKDNLVAKLNV